VIVITESKRRQGQRGSEPKPICPVCNEYLKRVYIRVRKNNNWHYAPYGWTCTVPSCDHMVKDFVELEDTEEGEKEE
jgi:hypothetical protein